VISTGPCLPRLPTLARRKRFSGDRRDDRSGTGRAAGSPFFKAIPYIVAVTFVAGLGPALVLRSRNPQVHPAIGRTVMEETHERA
jgi:hypothetical protein